MGMSFSMSPGVTTREWDLTTIVPQVATSGAAYVGAFEWGPVDKIKTVSDKGVLQRYFGNPSSETYLHWFSAANFLEYSRNLKVVRVIDKNVALNAETSGTGQLVLNEADWNDQNSNGNGGAGDFIARYPGTLGNSLGIYMADKSAYSAVGAITIVSAGDGYTTADDDGASVIITPPQDPAGVQAVAVINVPSDGGVATITVTTPGTGYTFPPTVTLPDPVGGGTTGTAAADLWKYRDQFLAAPGTSDFVSSRGGADDEMHIILIDETGKITGEKGSILERFPFVSKAGDAKYDDGTTAFYKSVLRDASAYVFWFNYPPLTTNWGQPAAGISFDMLGSDYSKTFSAGADGNATVSNNELLPGWDMFRNPENVDIGILISGAGDRVLQEYLIQNIAEHRKDCVAVISPELTDVVRNPGNELEDTLTLRGVLTSSSYGIFDCNWKYQFDAFNDTYRWVPCNPDVAGIMAYTDENRDPWWSPAGYNRGHIKNVVKLAWNPDKTDRDELYKSGINPIVTFKGEGTILFGDKTMLTKPSAFDRINVRRLFIVLEKAIAKASKYALFEFNDELTRMRFVQMVEPYLRDVQGRRGLTGFKVICDETNNTGYVIDSNGFVGDLYIKPNRSINFIALNFVATPTGVEFSEVEGVFGDF